MAYTIILTVFNHQTGAKSELRVVDRCDTFYRTEDGATYRRDSRLILARRDVYSLKGE